MKTIRFEGVEHNFPDDFTDDEIAAALDSVATSPSPSPKAAARLSPGKPKRAPDLSGLLPPAYAATLASIPPMSLHPATRSLMGGVGGAIGEAQRQLEARLLPVMGITPDPNPLHRIIRSGSEQAALQSGGDLLAYGAQAAAKGLMSAGLRPTPSLRKEFPNVNISQAALDEGTAVGKLPLIDKAKGSEKAAALRDQSAGNTQQLLNSNRRRFTVQELAEAAIKDVEKVVGAGRRMIGRKQRQEAIANVRRVANELLGKKAPGAETRPRVFPSGQAVDRNTFTPAEIKLIVQAADDALAPTYGKIAKGDAPALTGMEMPIASQGRKLIHQDPLVAASDARTQKLKALTQSLIDAESKSQPQIGSWWLPATVAGAGGGAFQGGLEAGDLGRSVALYLAARGALSPEVLTRLALMFNSPFTRGGLQQLPRVGYGLSQQFTPAESDQGR